jgi:hypothetical protein
MNKPLPKINEPRALPSAKAEKFLLDIWVRMFASVGRVYSPDVTGKPDWFLSSSWTPKQYKTFRNWLVKEGIRRMRWPKRQANKEASLFLLFCGWSINLEDDTGRPKTSKAR